MPNWKLFFTDNEAWINQVFAWCVKETQDIFNEWDKLQNEKDTSR